jgi:hypothetical protein
MSLMAAVGCTGIHAVGPLAGRTGGDGKADRDPGPPDPVVIPAPTPTPPKCLVRPEDVTTDNVDTIKRQLSAEFEFDRNNMPSVPVTAEVSRYQGTVDFR